jgi:hypothetical protein
VIVIADNCTDSTADEAAAAGAAVLIRDDLAHPGKGRALRWAIDAVLAAPHPPDGIVIVDADSVADSGLLTGLADALVGGHVAAQADYTVLTETQASPGDQLRGVAVMLYNRTRNLGRAAVGLPSSLLGNGMLLSREYLEAYPWNAFSAVEDLEFGIMGRIQGLHPRFIGGQGVRGPLPIGYSAGRAQKMRWEGGRFHALRQQGPALLARFWRHPDLPTLDALLDIAIPPLSIVVLLTSVGLLASLAAAFAGAATVAAPAIWALGVVLAAVHVFIGLRAAGAPGANIRMVMAVPGFLVWKLSVYSQLIRSFDPNRWERSLRKGEVEWR